MRNKSLKRGASAVCLLDRRLIISHHFQQYELNHFPPFVTFEMLRGKKETKSKDGVSSKKSFGGNAFSSRVPATQGEKCQDTNIPTTGRLLLLLLFER